MSIRAGLVAAGLSAVLVAGCATPRHVAPGPELLPTAFRNAGAPPDATRPPFAIDLGDPALARLLDRAARTGVDAEAALARLTQARAVARQADAARLPELGATASAQRRQVSVVPGVAFGPRRLTLLSAGLEASWEADLFGRLSAEARAAFADARAANADLSAVRLAIAGDVARGYVALRAAEARLALAARSTAAQGQLARLAGSRARAGLESEFDPARADALAAQTDAATRDLAAQREMALGSLAVLVGATPAEIAGELAEGAGALPALPRPVAANLPATLLSSRPDVARDLARLAAADDRTAARVRDRLPRLALAASAGATATNVGDLLDPASQVYSLVAELVAPVLDFGRRRAAVDQARGVADERAAELRGTLLLAVREVEDALAESRERREQALTLCTALERQRRAVRLARSRYTSGLEDLTSALNAERTALQIEEAVIDARSAELQSLVALWRATGGDAAMFAVEAP